MSGSVVGGVIGAAIGLYFGNPQLGWMIGSAVGGYVDPEQVFGPRLDDARTQSAMPGVYITRGWGTFRTAGNVIWQEPTIIEHTRTQRQGKGGPEQVTYYYTRSHAVGICRGPVVGILIVKENGKVVLDRRTDEVILAEYAASGITGYEATQRLRQQRAQNGKFLANTTFYFGTEDQLPDPVIEEHKGVGNVPAYPGLCYMVRENPELIMQGAISQYEFVVVGEGTAQTIEVDGWGATDYSRFLGDGDSFPLLDDPETEYESFQAQLSGVGSDTFTSLSEALAWADANDGLPTSPSILVGYKGDNPGPWSLTSAPMIGHGSTDDLSNNRAIWMCYQWREPAVFHDDVWIAGDENLYLHYSGVDGVWRCDSRGWLFTYTGPSSMETIPPLAIYVVAKRLSPEAGAGPGEVPLPDNLGWVVDPNGTVRALTDYGPAESGSFLALASEVISGDGMEYTRRELGPVLETTDPIGTEEWWTSAYNAAVAAARLPGGMTFDATGNGDINTYPRDITSAYPAIPLDDTSVDPDLVIVATVVGDLCRDSGLASTEYDVSELTDEIPGFRIASEGGADSAIAALQNVYLFDVGEWDGKVRFVKRGGTASFSINGDDLVERDGDPFEVETIQEVELLRKVTVGYSDPAAGYGPNTQVWERRTSIIDARGEASFELPITIPADTAATASKRRGMVAWGEPEKHKFSLPMRLSYITPTDVGNYTDEDGEARQVRVMQAEDDSGIREMESATNCPEAYNATATGVTPLPPTITTGQLRGPTYAVYMNLPSLRTSDNVPGVYIAATGLLSGWAGATILLSVDGGVSYQAVTTFLAPSTMGRLTASVTSSGEPISVQMNSGTLQSVTDEQIALRHNAFAITTVGTSEVGQFKTATAGGSGAYELTDTYRGQVGTTASSHNAGDPFVMVDSMQFLPLDISLAGRTLYFKAVSLGTSSDSAMAIPFVFDPLFTNVTTSALTHNGELITVGGQTIYVVNSNA